MQMIAGQTMMPTAQPLGLSEAFLSYARVDDQFLSGAMSRLRDELQLAIRAVTGQPFRIFQDMEGIEFGQHWPEHLEEALRSARFLIPILTPSYFTSVHCRDEALKFLEYEDAAGRSDLILPIYLIEAPDLERLDRRANDSLAWRLHDRQHDDWRSLRLECGWQPKVKERVADLARAMSRAAERVAVSNTTKQSGKDERGFPDSSRENALVKALARKEAALQQLEGEWMEDRYAFAFERQRLCLWRKSLLTLSASLLAVLSVAIWLLWH